MTNQRDIAGSTSNLTPAQLLIWAGQQRSPHAPLYNMALNYTIVGPLDRGIFAHAFQSVVDRCDAMRTVFRSDQGVPTRVVLATHTANIVYLDVSTEPDPVTAARQWTQERCQNAFDLRGPLYDTALIKLAERKHVWYFNQHHLVSDAWSFGLIYRHVSDAYESLSAEGGKSQGAPPQFEAIASSLSASTGRQQATDHWKGRLAAAVPPPRLYGESSSAESTRTDRYTASLTAKQCEGLASLAQQPEFRLLTPHMSQYCLIATALYAFLYRVTGQEQLAIGCPAHNRPSLKLRQTVGLFIELYPQQIEIESGETFASLFRKVQAEAGLLLRHAQSGSCDPELHSTFNVVLNYITATFGEFAGAPMQSEWLHPGHGDPAHDLRVQVHDFDGGGTLRLHFDFNTEVFDAASSGMAVQHFVRVLNALLAHSDQLIDDVDLVSDEEKNLLVKGVVRPRDSDRAVTATQMFESQVARTPDAIAVACGDDEMSYRDLDTRAERLADRLAVAGLCPGDAAAICMKRSIETIVSMLAVMKAGSVWVPLDPSYPDKRIRFVLEDADVAVLLTDSSSAGGLPVGCQTICVDQPESSQPVEAKRAVFNPKPDQPAYVIYTSGSTGQPKGVVIPNRAFVNYITWAREKYVGSQRLTFPLFTPVAFDLTLTSIFVPLVSGGRVQVYPETADHSDLAILEVLDDNKVDIVKLTPSHLALLQERDLSESRISQLILGGEDLKRDVAERARQSLGSDVVLHNEYGPTEATVGCILHTFEPERDLGPSVPIGKPIDNMTAYVLNDRLRLCPIGVPGGLFLAGESLATEYWNRPELTAEQFIENPFLPGTRMYRTGDVARVRRCGTIEYLGRSDEQVKVRGSRIELGEIEAALRNHSGITACVASVVHSTDETPPEVVYCRECGLPSNYPDAAFDSQGVCNQCTAFAAWQHKASTYFRTMDDLRAIFANSRSENREYDCLALLSGGKDSTYALCQLVELGLNVLAFTLDNGYISQEAKENIDRVVATLDVDHVYGSTPAMNAIFVDSLKRHANVCNGCFKTIYTLSLQTARARNIPYIVTGLSRGQFFETRLTEELFQSAEVDVEHIDETILEARKAYHRVDDAVSQLLDVESLQDDRVFEEVRFIDFYRYCPVELDEMLAYLDERVPWIRPSDTGRSTNCLINDVGIHFHKMRRGYHNYAFPYSWDVRMGHKTRDAAIAELNDEIDEENVERILAEIGFDEPIKKMTTTNQLVAWYLADQEIPSSELRADLLQTLPRFMVPSHFVRVERIPLTTNGKVDRASLPLPASRPNTLKPAHVAPRTRNERILADIWAGALRLERVGIRDHFLDLGGDSITAIQIVGRANKAGLLISVDQLFDFGCIEPLADRARESGALAAEQGVVSGEVCLTPIQCWFFEQQPIDPNYWNQSLTVQLEREVDEKTLEVAFTELVKHHDALRLSFRQNEAGRWTAFNQATPAQETILQSFDVGGLSHEAQADQVREVETRLNRGLNLQTGSLIRAALLRGSDNQQLIIAVHHLAIDAMSWPILLTDLTSLYEQLSESVAVSLPRKTTSYQRWSRFLLEYADSQEARTNSNAWQEGSRFRIPVDECVEARGHRASVRVQLTHEDSQRFEEKTLASRARGHEVLLAGLCQVLSQWTGQEAVHVDVETHGRENLSQECDLSRTVGWFTGMFPLAVTVDRNNSTRQILHAVQSKLRAMPNHGLGFGITRYLCSDDTVREQVSAWQSDVLFNYLGAMEELVRPGNLIRYKEPLKLFRSPTRSRVRHLIEINVWTAFGQLQIDWTYQPDHHCVETIERQANSFADVLRGFSLQSDPVQNATQPDDFPLAKLDASKLDKLANLLHKTDNRRGHG